MTNKIPPPVLDFEGADPSQDLEVSVLAPVPFWIAILQKLAIHFRDKWLSENVEEQLGEFTEQIVSAIEGKNVGYLLRVRLFVDENGVPSVPGGQLIEAMATGSEPIQALAYYINKREYRPQTPFGMKDASVYFWVHEKDGKYVTSTIPKGAVSKFESDAINEARRLTLLGVPFAISSQSLISVNRAAFWSELAVSKSNELNIAEERRKLLQLTGKFVATQNAFNAAYREYQIEEKRYRAEQSHLAVLGKLSTVLQVISTGIQAGKAISADNKTKLIATGEGTFDSDRERTQLIKETSLRYLETIRPSIEQSGKELVDLEVTIRDIYKTRAIEIPPDTPPLAPILLSDP